jgi:hypothetical protein
LAGRKALRVDTSGFQVFTVSIEKSHGAILACMPTLFRSS